MRLQHYLNPNENPIYFPRVFFLMVASAGARTKNVVQSLFQLSCGGGGGGGPPGTASIEAKNCLSSTQFVLLFLRPDTAHTSSCL